MRNKNNSFSRTDETSRAPNHRVEWLDFFAEKLAIEEQSKKTAVEVARERQDHQPSIYEMMSSIVSGTKSKYSSVEEAVQDYQHRTGLAQYLKAQSDESKATFASYIIQASEDLEESSDEYLNENLSDEIDEALDFFEDEGLDAFVKALNDCAEDYSFKGRKKLKLLLQYFRENKTKKELSKLDFNEAQDVNKITLNDLIKSFKLRKEDEEDSGDADSPFEFLLDLKKKTLNEPKDEADVSFVIWNPEKERLESLAADKPALVVSNPAIESFVINMIDTNPGMQIPALLHSLVETFSRDGVSQDILFDTEFLDWINSLLIGKQSVIDRTPSHIGRGVGTQIDYRGEKDSNRDPFTLLVPDKGIY